MSEKKTESKASLEIQSCPNCGNPIFLGDEFCNVCGQNVVSVRDRIKRQPPNVVAIAGFAIGILFSLAATGMENPWRVLAMLIAFGSITGGGVFYALHLLFLTGDDRREKLGKKGGWWRG